MKKLWPTPPSPPDDNACTGFRVGESRETPMHSRNRTGEAPTWDSMPVELTVCKHGKGSCEECGTTNRRDSVHTTEGGRGAIGRIAKRR